MRDRPPQAAAIYARISHDPSGERSGVQRQEDDCRAEASRRGWRVADVYVDDDRSAFNIRRQRPEYERMLSDLRDGVRDGVMIWRLDRLHRQPRELEEFIVICDKAKVALATVTGDVDLATTQGRLLARAWGAFAAHESEVKSERLTRAALERARHGNDQWTQRMYGYGEDLFTVNPAEAKVIRAATKRMLTGDSLWAIAADLNRNRVRTVTGIEWTPMKLRSLLMNPRIAGLSQYHGEVVGKGRWRAIIRPSESARLLELFHDRERHDTAPHSPHLLTGLLRCAYCGLTLFATSRVGTWCRKRAYSCARRPGRKGCGRISIQADALEALVLTQMLERLGAEVLLQRPARAAARGRPWLAALAELNRAEGLLASMAADTAVAKLSKREWKLMRPAVVKRIELAKAVVMEDRYQRAIAEFVGHPELLESRWDEFSLARRRSLCRSLIDHVVIGPALVGQLFVNPQRISIAWLGDPPFKLARKVFPPALRQCSIRGCRRVHVSKGFCQMHYSRSKTTGSPGGVRPQNGHWYLGKVCKLDRCSAVSASAGLCQTHYGSWIRETAELPRCLADGCERPAMFADGWCLNHHRQRRRAQEQQLDGRPGTRPYKHCKALECVEEAGQAGFCSMHYQQWLDETAEKPRCRSTGCERPAEVFGWCSKHQSYFRYQRRYHPERIVGSGNRTTAKVRRRVGDSGRTPRTAD